LTQGPSLCTPPLQANKQTGLDEAGIAERFAFFGFNELAEKTVHPLIRFLSYFWAPMPIMVRRRFWSRTHGFPLTL
jgi:hypothetical protein